MGGRGGLRQQLLGASNACALAAVFVDAGIEVVVADVLTPRTLAVYRDRLPGCVVVHLTVPLEEAWRRAATRTVWLTDEEFVALHRADTATDLDADHVIDVRDLTPDEQVEAVEELWRDVRSGWVDEPTESSILPPTRGDDG